MKITAIVGGAIFASLPLGTAPLCAQHEEPLAEEQLGKEPLVVTRMVDPDPYFIAPSREDDRRSARRAADADANSSLDLAMENIGRVIGQATILEQQRIAATCHQPPDEGSTAEQRFAWVARCRYARH